MYRALNRTRRIQIIQNIELKRIFDDKLCFLTVKRWEWILFWPRVLETMAKIRESWWWCSEEWYLWKISSRYCEKDFKAEEALYQFPDLSCKESKTHRGYDPSWTWKLAVHTFASMEHNGKHIWYNLKVTKRDRSPVESRCYGRGDKKVMTVDINSRWNGNIIHVKSFSFLILFSFFIHFSTNIYWPPTVCQTWF